ncbi:ZIP family metal transporter [Elongatibacter sediminis]|uniref:ZIP family metal transporter n=1 Tax=Elongatibacter sediminis TaxID=3119006 RepID=A0AAW9REH1_9GAMM
MTSAEIIRLGFIASLGAGLFTGVGALGVFFIRRLSARLEDGMLSFAAGVMLAATFFSLILPGIEFGTAQTDSEPAGVAVVIAGLLFGSGALFVIHRHVPHEHFVSGREGPEAAAFSRIWLFVIAITLHNFPEGMAVGVGFADGDIANGMPLATGIGLQNIPEGLAVAVALMSVGYGRLTAFALSLLTGLAEPLGGIFGAAAVSLAAPLMAGTLGFAAGAMLFIISDEIIPETHARGSENLATFSLLGGFALMMFLDAALG